MRAMELVAPYTLRERVVPEPRAADLGPGEVLVHVRAGGICGSDLPHFRGVVGTSPAPPGYPLHETTGVVLASRHRRIRPGGSVVGWATGFDGMADQVVAHGSELHVHAPHWTPERAIVIQPLACVLYAVRQLGAVRGRRVAVLGLGAIGLLFAHVLADRGAEVVAVDRVDRRAAAQKLDLAPPIVADVVEWVDSVPEHDRPDVVIEAIGHASAPLTAALRLVRARGLVYAFGVPDEEFSPFPVELFLRRNLRLVSGITLDRARMLGMGEKYLQKHPELADVLVTDVVDLADAQSAFERALAPAPGQLKLVLRMEGGPQ